MKLKVVSGAQVKLFRTRKAQYLAQALTLGVTNASGPGIPQPNFVSRNEQRDITALGRSLVIFSFGNVAYGFFIQFAECLPWRAGSCFRADALQSKVASLDFDNHARRIAKSATAITLEPLALWGPNLDND